MFQVIFKNCKRNQIQNNNLQPAQLRVFSDYDNGDWVLRDNRILSLIQ